MLRYQIASSISSNGQFTLLIEAPIRDTLRDHIEISEDVVQIADKAAVDFQKFMREYIPKTPKKASQKKKIKVKEDRTEHQISSDVDPTKLRPCKHAS
uniref:Uncharacterized protein n=1 Tax=Caenorhabditis japonica TaxID=281687 RepID=A0A8R1HU51_CAEJA